MSVSRIAYVVYVFPKISETFIAREIIELETRSVEVMLFALECSRQWQQHEFVREHGLVDRCLHNREDFSRLVAERRPDLIHAHFATEPTGFARELSREHRIPFTFTAHGYDVY